MRFLAILLLLMTTQCADGTATNPILADIYMPAPSGDIATDIAAQSDVKDAYAADPSEVPQPSEFDAAETVHPPASEEPTWVTPAVEAQRIQHRTFRSEAIGEEVSYHVFVPLPYETETEKRFPVIYWLHGGGGGLPGIRPLSQHFAEAMRQERIPPALVVFPNGLALSMWVNSKDDRTPLETIVIDELIPHIDATFRTQAGREGRVIEGFSMGGYGAARFAFRYPGLFRAVALWGAGPLQPVFDHGPRVSEEQRAFVFETIYGGDMDYYQELSPWRLAEEHQDDLREGLRIRIVVGDQDELLEMNEDFHEHLDTLGIPHEFQVVEGAGHETAPLRSGLEAALWEFY